MRSVVGRPVKGSHLQFKDRQAVSSACSILTVHAFLRCLSIYFDRRHHSRSCSIAFCEGAPGDKLPSAMDFSNVEAWGGTRCCQERDGGSDNCKVLSVKSYTFFLNRVYWSSLTKICVYV